MDMNKKELIKLGIEEIIAKGDFGAIDELFMTEYIAHAGGKDYKGHAFIKRWTKQLRTAIPDIKLIKVEIYLQTDDTIVWQRTFRGTHRAKLKGVSPTGRRVEWRDMVISRFQGEKIIEEWIVSELAGEILSKKPRQ